MIRLLAETLAGDGASDIADESGCGRKGVLCSLFLSYRGAFFWGC
jgi:hypothetical protein